MRRPIDDKIVDQATYTAYDRTYPEGTLYWRVQAIDGEGNGLTWSPARTLTKSSPAPVLSAPVDDEQTDGAQGLPLEPR